jgi:hypothetical protein
MALTWTLQTPPAANTFVLPAADTNGNVLMVGASNTAYRSTNGGVSFSSIANVGGANNSGCAFGNGIFLLSNNSTIYRSTDGGTTFNQATTSPTFPGASPPNFAYSPSLGMWMAIANGGSNTVLFATSTDNGVNWSVGTSVPGTTFMAGAFPRKLIWDGTWFLFAARDSSNNVNLNKSTNGSTWTQTLDGTIFDNPGGDIVAVTYNANLGEYVFGYQNGPYIKRGTSLGSLTAVNLSAVTTGCSATNDVASSPLGQEWVLSGFNNSNGNGSQISTAAIQGGSSGWARDSSPLAAGGGSYLYGLVYDSFHGVFIGVGTNNGGGGVVTAPFTDSPTIAISPTTATVPLGGTQLFVASTTLPVGESVIWSVNGIVDGNNTLGDVVNGTNKLGQVVDGYYVAPRSKASTLTTVTITATRQDIPTLKASAVITISGFADVFPPVVTPPQNVTAPAGVGGDKWGANGGGITPVGVSKPLAATLSNGERASNYRPVPLTIAPGPGSVDEQASDGALGMGVQDSLIGFGGSNQG